MTTSESARRCGKCSKTMDGWSRNLTSCEGFLEAYRPGREGCLLLDAYLPGMSGLDLLKRLKERGDHLPAIMITGAADVTMAVDAMKAGALDFVEKPIGRDDLLACVTRALEHAQDASKLSAWQESAAAHVAGLTARQRQIMELVVAGHPSKNIAADLGISQRTVENHRASIMKKMGAKSIPELARISARGRLERLKAYSWSWGQRRTWTVDRMAELLAVETWIRGCDPPTRPAARRQASRPIVHELHSRRENDLPWISGKSKLAEATGE